MKRIIITLCICTAWVASTYAQYPYTLKKCLEEGLANNYSIRITRNEEQISHVSIRPRACFFPLFSFLPLWLHYNLNPLCVQY